MHVVGNGTCRASCILKSQSLIIFATECRYTEDRGLFKTEKMFSMIEGVLSIQKTEGF
jgi:hypothetical protein